MTNSVPNTTGTNPPKLKAPAGATDCHIHIYDPRFQPAVKRPTEATVADYRLLQKRLGFSRVVIVQPRNYATDNSVTRRCDQAARHRERARGGRHPSDGDGRRAEALERRRDTRHTLHHRRLAHCHHHRRHDRAAGEAHRALRLARAAQHAGRADRRARRCVAAPAGADGVRSHGQGAGDPASRPST